MHTRLVGKSLLVLALSLVSLMQTPTKPPQNALPQPQWSRQPADPPWLAYAVQFHGHLGPWAVSGIRFGMAGREAIAAEGYFDLQVTCRGAFQKPPKSCFLDGLQVATGATLGKRNLKWIPGKEIAVEFTNTQSGKTAVVRPTRALLDLLSHVPRPVANKAPRKAGDDEDHDHGLDQATLESLARQIAALPAAEIVNVELQDRPRNR